MNLYFNSRYQITYKRENRSLFKEVSTGILASAALTVGTLFGFLTLGIYLWRALLLIRKLLELLDWVYV